MSLSQHAIVQYKESGEEHPVEINESNYNRNNQQHHSTPIHNFRTLRSREISVVNSQNCIEPPDMSAADIGRPRSDSMETDKGNPMQDKVLSNLESHLQQQELLQYAEAGENQ